MLAEYLLGVLINILFEEYMGVLSLELCNLRVLLASRKVGEGSVNLR